MGGPMGVGVGGVGNTVHWAAAATDCCLCYGSLPACKCACAFCVLSDFPDPVAPPCGPAGAGGGCRRRARGAGECRVPGLAPHGAALGQRAAAACACTPACGRWHAVASCLRFCFQFHAHPASPDLCSLQRPCSVPSRAKEPAWELSSWVEISWRPAAQPPPPSTSWLAIANPC